MCLKFNKRLVTTLLVFMSLFIISSSVLAAPGTSGKWSNRTQTLFVQTGMSSKYVTAYNSGASKWRTKSNFNVSTKTGSITNAFAASTTYDSSAGWDGIAYSTTSSNGIRKSSKIYFNTYYTGRSVYTASILSGIATHETGHGLGLTHTSTVETSSVMFPYTFKSDGKTSARSLSPSSADIFVVNKLYPKTSSSKSLEETDDSDTVTLTPSWVVYYENEEELADAADLIIEGTVGEHKNLEYTKDQFYTYTTISDVNVKDIIKGKELNEGGNIEIRQMGGTDGETTVITHDSTILQEGQNVILFLRQLEDGTYSPINQDDSIYLKTKIGDNTTVNALSINKNTKKQETFFNEKNGIVLNNEIISNIETQY